MHHSAKHWANLAERPDEILKDEQGILALAEAAFASDPHMVDLAAYADELTHTEVTDIILSMSKPYKSELYHRDGGKVETADYDSYQASLNLENLADKVVVRFGMVLQRADMRTWPTNDVVFKSQETFDLDRFQENALFPADMVAVLHESNDGHWVFVQSFNYAAWVQKNSIAIGQRNEILDYKNDERFLVVTGSKVTTNFNPHAPTISELQLDMGIRLPLADLEESDHSVDGQDHSASHAPFTRRNIIAQAFKFLGERYGWGHSYNARDCTGLVAEVYKSFGIQLPRNSGQQGLSPIGDSIEFTATSSEEDKLNAVVAADVGDLLYSTGHVMLYLGTVDDMPYVIHDLSGFGWAGEDGEVQEAVLNGVSVTPLMTLHSSRDTTYFEEIYAIKTIR